MGVNIENRFNKALRILDLGQIEKAELILNEIIIEAREKTDNLSKLCLRGIIIFNG